MTYCQHLFLQIQPSDNIGSSVIICRRHFENSSLFHQGPSLRWPIRWGFASRFPISQYLHFFISHFFLFGENGLFFPQRRIDILPLIILIVKFRSSTIWTVHRQSDPCSERMSCAGSSLMKTYLVIRFFLTNIIISSISMENQCEIPQAEYVRIV